MCRWKWIWVCCLGLSVGVAAPARSELAAFHGGRLSLRFGWLYGLETPAAAQPGLSGEVDVTRAAGGALAKLSLPAGLFQADARFTFGSPPPFAPARGVDLSFSNASGSFVPSAAGTGTPFGGTLPLSGIHRVCLFFPCGDPLATSLTVPLAVVGSGGIASTFEILRVAIAGAPWSTGSVTVDAPEGATSMVAGGLTPTTGGATRIQLVTPLMISTNGVAPNGEELPPVRGLALLTLVVAPEPGRASLLVAAVGSLLWIGAIRMRRTG